MSLNGFSLLGYQIYAFGYAGAEHVIGVFSSGIQSDDASHGWKVEIHPVVASSLAHERMAVIGRSGCS